MVTAYQGSMDNCALAKGVNLSMSWKVGYEIANQIRGKEIKKAIALLERVIEKKEAVPYKRYNSDVGHKPGNIAAGRYPAKASTFILKVLKSAVGNAIDKGLNEESLVLIHIAVSKGSSQWHYGRKTRRQFKSANLDIVLKEVAAKPVVKKQVTIDKTEKSSKTKVDEKINLKEDKSESVKPDVKKIKVTDVKEDLE